MATALSRILRRSLAVAAVQNPTPQNPDHPHLVMAQVQRPQAPVCAVTQRKMALTLRLHAVLHQIPPRAITGQQNLTQIPTQGRLELGLLSSTKLI